MVEEKKYKKMEGGNVVKLEKDGDSIAGILLGFEESKMFKDSYAISMRVGDEIQVVFTSAIPIDIIKKNDLVGKDCKIVYTGKQKTQDNKFEYKNYEVFSA